MPFSPEKFSPGKSEEEKGREEEKEEPKDGRETEVGKSLDASDLFRTLVNSGLERFKNREEIEQGLEKDGVEKEDIEMAMECMMCLAVVNSAVFGDSIELNFCSGGGEREPINVIEYIPEGKGQKERYQVSVEEFAKAVRNAIRDKKGKVLLNEKGEIAEDFEGAPSQSLEETLIGTAVHEVRHRLQKKGKINMISPKKRITYRGRSIDDIIEYRQSWFKNIREKLRKEGKLENKHINRQTGAEELDAKVIEDLVVSRVHYQNNSLEELSKLVTLQPEE